MRSRADLLCAAVTVLTAACHRGPRLPENDPAALAALRAEQRTVNGDVTWVTHGNGYELVGWSKPDLVAVQSQLDREAAMLSRVFPGDSLARVVVTVRRIQPVGKPFVAAPPVPNTTHGAIVDVVLPDPKAKKDDAERRGPAGAFGAVLLGARQQTSPVVRAWISARASALTHQPAHSIQAAGESVDPRVPGWAESVISTLGADSLVDAVTVMLAAHPDDLIRLSTYFTMARPERMVAYADERVRGGVPGGGAIPGGGGGGGTRGGIGGRGGMGGGGRGGVGRTSGRGGTRGGGGSGRSGADRPMPPLEGLALFEAQSVVLGKYLSREGYDLMGAMVDAQILGGSVAPVLTKRTGRTLEQTDADLRQWVIERADLLHR